MPQFDDPEPDYAFDLEMLAESLAPAEEDLPREVFALDEPEGEV